MGKPQILIQIEESYGKACELSSKHVENLARKILSEKPHLNEFVMGMGVFFFTQKNDCESIDQFSGEPWMEELTDFIYEWDSVLKITGDPMRFTATGKKVTEW